MVSWEEYQSFEYANSNYEDTNIECPNCKTERLLRDISVVLTSYPPQYRYICPKCHWTGVGH